MRFGSLNFAIMAITLAAPLVSSARTSPPITQAGDVRGVSWSDPRDNYNLAQIVPTGLSLDGSLQDAQITAAAVADRAAKVGANVVRVGINPPTVADVKGWPIYAEAIRTIAHRGVGVIVCAWEQSADVQGNGRKSHNGRFGEGTVESYAAMWKAVHAEFRDEPNVVGYELLNEPFGYVHKTDEYVHDMKVLIAAIGDDRNAKHILIAGVGYSDDLQAIRRAFPQPNVWFAYHVYPNWFGGESGNVVFTRQRYADGIAAALKGVEDRTVITEFGCWGGEAYDYSKPADAQKTLNAKRHVAYLQGVADACVRLKLGSIYWFADARESTDRPAYDLFTRSGSVLDEDRMAEIQRAWRLPTP